MLTRLAERVIARRAELAPASSRYRVTRAIDVPMRDGVSLLADHYAPLVDSPAGTLLLRGPYARDWLPTRATMGSYAARGYHVVLQSTRGGFGSGGSFEPGFGEVDDGADTVAWLRRQPWFTGTFATVGSSYLGFTQWAVLAGAPSELSAAVIAMGPHDLGQQAWGTGAFALFDYLTWGYGMAWHERGGTVHRLVRSLLTPRRLRPVLSRLPLRAAADAVMGDGAQYYRHWLEHADPSDDYWNHRRAITSFGAIRAPVLLIGGWQDVFVDQTIAQFTALRAEDADVALVIGPWTHGEGGAHAMRESLDWVAGLRRRLPVRIFVTGGGGWRELPDWPPPSQDVVLYPRPGSVLADAPADAGASLRFRYDPSDPTPTIGGRLLMAVLAGYRDDRALAERADVCAFTGPVLASDLEIIGTPCVELAHTVDAESADVAVRLSDVDSNGRSHNVSDGYVRVDGRSAGPLRIALDPVAHRFRAGHRIRMPVAGGSFPRFARNHGTGEPAATAVDFVASTHVIDCSRSRLVLPGP